MMENTSINLYIDLCIDFFIIIKKVQNIGKNFCTDLIYIYLSLNERCSKDVITNFFFREISLRCPQIIISLIH